ncbi:MAG: hypothetical protein VX874_13950 [Pseudomonadota bacterium]|nr:hypothetical protein [Pseudomonadota bacterium]
MHLDFGDPFGPGRVRLNDGGHIREPRAHVDHDGKGRGQFGNPLPQRLHVDDALSRRRATKRTILSVPSVASTFPLAGMAQLGLCELAIVPD